MDKKNKDLFKKAGYEVRKAAIKKHGASEKLPSGKTIPSKKEKIDRKRNKGSRED